MNGTDPGEIHQAAFMEGCAGINETYTMFSDRKPNPKPEKHDAFDLMPYFFGALVFLGVLWTLS